MYGGSAYKPACPNETLQIVLAATNQRSLGLKREALGRTSRHCAGSSKRSGSNLNCMRSAAKRLSVSPSRHEYARTNSLVATLLVLREQVRSVLVECVRTGEELLTQAEIVENTNGHKDWIELFGRWKERTLAELRTVYDGQDIPLEFDAVTFTTDHSAPRFTFPYRKMSLERGLWELRDLEKRLPLAVEPEASRRDTPVVASESRTIPYGSRSTTELVTAAEDHFLEHKQTLRYDVRTKQANPKLEDAVMERICGFWNADGGTLLIGVEDRTGLVTGLASDLKLVQDLDALLNRLSQRLRNDVPSIAPFVRVKPDSVAEELVLRIDIPAGDRAVFCNDRLMVRINNTTQELKGQSQLDYIRSRFGRA
jgi:hypothetical protein